MEKNNTNNSYRYGSLPEKAPLAVAYIPMQQGVNPHYEPDEALAAGTLFPGLDLPFMDIINPKLKSTPLTEMMAIDFVADELELYLDNHCQDMEAFALYQTFLALKKEARERYVKLCGPVAQTDMLGMDCYAWPDNPWPWDYQPQMEV